MFPACVFRSVHTIIWFLGWDNCQESSWFAHEQIWNQSYKIWPIRCWGHLFSSKLVGNFSLSCTSSAQETTRLFKYCISLKPQDRILNILFSTRALYKMAGFYLILATFVTRKKHLWNKWNIYQSALLCNCFSFSLLPECWSSHQQSTRPTTGRTVRPLHKHTIHASLSLS